MSKPVLDGALRQFMFGKLHRVTVTGADLHYVGSITIDPVLLEASGIMPNTAIEISNITNGNRLTTYVIEGERGSGVICLNGSTAHQFSKGDLAIVMAYELVPANHLPGRISRAVHVDSDNQIVDIDEYITPSLETLGQPQNNRQEQVYETVDV